MTELEKKYYLIDASKQPLGRMATVASILLRDKISANYISNKCPNNIVIIINAANIYLTGNKSISKTYNRYTGFHGGVKTKDFFQLSKENPKKLIEKAVKGMLPKNRLIKNLMANLKIYDSKNHQYKKEQIIEIKV